MMDDLLSLQRREFLQQSGVLALATVAPTAAIASEIDTHSVVVYREDIAASRAFAQAMQQQGLRAVAIGNDIVRQWRDELQSLVIGEGYRLMGHTGYADWFMFRGLAAEHRRFPRHEHQSNAHGFDWVI